MAAIGLRHRLSTAGIYGSVIPLIDVSLCLLVCMYALFKTFSGEHVIIYKHPPPPSKKPC